jgi:hypothetical protein
MVAWDGVEPVVLAFGEVGEGGFDVGSGWWVVREGGGGKVGPEVGWVVREVVRVWGVAVEEVVWKVA